MNCPTCHAKAHTLPGGNQQAAGYLRYYDCPDCGIKFSVVGTVVRILPDEPESSFKNPREAARVLRQAVRDDREWFGEVSDDTETLARQVIGYLVKNRKVTASRRTGLAFGRKTTR